jgi:hypothetical protein
MSSSDRDRASDPDGHDAQSSPPAQPPAAVEGARPRHAAITRNLNTWSSYQTWAEQVRDSWEPGAAASAEPEALAEPEPLTETAAKK